MRKVKQEGNGPVNLVQKGYENCHTPRQYLFRSTFQMNHIHQKPPILTLGGTCLRSIAQPRRSFENCSNGLGGQFFISDHLGKLHLPMRPSFKVSLLVKKMTVATGFFDRGKKGDKKYSLTGARIADQSFTKN